MNQTIRLLAEQAGLEYNFDPMLWLKHEKFAEILLFECIKIAVFKGDSETAKAIRDHFAL